MKRQLIKIRNAAENFRSNKAENNKNNDDSLQKVEAQVEKYKDVLEKITKKLSQPSSAFGSSSSSNQNHDDQRDKRCKKVNEFRIGQTLEDSSRDVHGPLREIFEHSARLQKEIAIDIVTNELDVENNVTKKLMSIMETHTSTIGKQKKIVGKLMQDFESASHKYTMAQKLNENVVKINQLREEQEEIETKLEKEKDILASEMYDFITQEENIANCIVNFITLQQIYYKSSLERLENTMSAMDDSIRKLSRRVFKVPLEEHLKNTNRQISYVIELCVCYLLKRGLNEEGLLRVGCAGSKLKRIKSAIDAKIFNEVLPVEYQDVHVMAGLLKSYLRDLPEPLLTYRLYNAFIESASKQTEIQRKTAILSTINMLPREHYFNLRYLTKFLSILAQNHQQNKMSTQNIAIVMSPNLLWAQNQNDSDYAQKVSSTAAVNTIVELLISDWNFFFEGDVDFYCKLSEDTLFLEIYNFSNDRDVVSIPMTGGDLMSKSMSAAVYTPASAGNNNSGLVSLVGSAKNVGAIQVSGSNFGSNGGAGDNNCGGSGGNKGGHSRSSSHDTSLILMSDNIKRSQSNSSLSDHSSPNQDSPQMPVRRRKYNKDRVAPTPPDLKSVSTTNQTDSKLTNPSVNMSMPSKTKLEEKFEESTNTKAPPDRPPQPQSTILRQAGSVENLNKPDKPPRPFMSGAESQTLNRSSLRMQQKPKALPRSTLNTGMKQTSGGDSLSSPNADSNIDADLGITLRGKNNEENRKPAIPERPASLFRPPSIKGHNYTQELMHGSAPDVNNQTEITSAIHNPIKKTQSFRSNSNNNNNSSNNFGGPTTLERTHIYNVDKQQVSFIDVTENSNVKMKDLQMIDDDDVPTHEDSGDVCAELEMQSLNIHTTANASEFQTSTSPVPPSPRGFDPKVKRPVVPAPPPPNRPRSSDGTSTNL